MRKIISFLLVCCVSSLSLGLTTLDAHAFSLEFRSIGTLTAPSAEVWLLDRETTIGTFDITVAYDPLLLAFNNVSFGSYLGDPNDPIDTITGADSLSSGTAYAFEVSYLNPLLDQPYAFPLFTINFDAIGTGTSSLLFDIVLIGDASGIPIIPAQLTPGSINATPVPEPGALLLLGIGLAGMAAWRRKSRS